MTSRQTITLVSSFYQKIVPYGSIFLLLILLLLALCPISLASTHATDLDTSPLASTASTKTTAHIYSQLAVALDNAVDIDLTPRSTGSFNTNRANLKIATNNTNGYSIYLQTIDGTPNLSNIDSHISNKIIGTTGMTANSYQNQLNTWGFALTDTPADENTEYQAVPATDGVMIQSTHATTTNDNYYLNFGVAVDSALPSGDYRNSVLVSVVANPVTVRGFGQIYYMQEMTASICESAETEERGQLVDLRDNKIYHVAKLKDGKCWMTQNLDLDLDSSVALTPEETNVATAWTSPVSTTKGDVYQITNVTDRHQSWNNSYDPGMFVVNNPDAAEACNQTNLQTCPSYTDVSHGYSATFTATATNAVDNTTRSYDAHYLVGNYYQANAALANASPQSNFQNFSNDICPKGWRLPKGALSRETYKDSDYYSLLAAYGWDNFHANASWENNYTMALDSFPASQLPTSAPLYFARTGKINPLNLNDDQSATLITGTSYQSRNIADVALGTNAINNTSAFVVVATRYLYPNAAFYASQGTTIRCIAK